MSRPVCIDDLTLPVADLEASTRFYRAALGALGWAELDVDGHPTWGPPGAEDFSLAPGSRPPDGMHIAFAVDTTAEVDAFHAAAVAAGGRDHGSPGERAHYHPGYYGAYVLDPDGNNVEAVCHGR